MKIAARSACLWTLLVATALEAEGAATNRYVATNAPSPGYPYDSWATAGANIKDVVDAANANNAGDLVIISNGTYWLTAQIAVSNVVVTNASGDRTQVVVNGNFPACTTRCFAVNHTNARLVCLTITNGAMTNANGGGIYLSSGCVSNCVIVGNRAWMTNATLDGGGGGVYMLGGEVNGCDIAGNTVSVDTSGRFGGGGGVGMKGGKLSYSRLAFNVATNGVVAAQRYNVGGGAFIYLAGVIDHCEIVSNASFTDYWMYGGGGVQLKGGGYLSNSLVMGNTSQTGGDSAGGGVSIMTAGIVRNCVIAFNRSRANSGAVSMNAPAAVGRVENCTIVSNINGGLFLRSFPSASGVAISNVVNSVIYWNQGPVIGGDANCKTALVSCCVSPNYDSTYLNPGGTTNDPLLVSIESGNFRLSSAQSSCYNRGVNLLWMDDAMDLDGHRRIDRVSGVADIGAYEYLPSITIFMGR